MTRGSAIAPFLYVPVQLRHFTTNAASSSTSHYQTRSGQCGTRTFCKSGLVWPNAGDVGGPYASMFRKRDTRRRDAMWIKILTIGSLLGLALTAGCDDPQAAASPAGESETTVIKGERAYAQSCAVCHGFNAQGMPNQGANLK